MKCINNKKSNIKGRKSKTMRRKAVTALVFSIICAAMMVVGSYNVAYAYVEKSDNEEPIKKESVSDNQPVIRIIDIDVDDEEIDDDTKDNPKDINEKIQRDIEVQDNYDINAKINADSQLIEQYDDDPADLMNEDEKLNLQEDKSASADDNSEIVSSTSGTVDINGAQELTDELFYNNPNYTKREIDLMAQVVHAEAGNQPFEGKAMVVDVILNRVDDERFPSSVEAVISAPRQFTSPWRYAKPTNEDYLAVIQEINVPASGRVTTTSIYFAAGFYHTTSNQIKVGGHCFSS